MRKSSKRRTETSNAPGATVVYEQVFDGEWFDIKTRGHREMCCDCHLVHIVNTRVRRVGNQLHVQQQCFRDNERTYAARRRAGIKITK